MMPRLALLLLGLALVACRRPEGRYRVPSADPATLRRPPAGDVIGGAGRYGSLAWLGIPYAVPPVGPRRWRAPEPLPAWTTPREALAFGAACPQYGSRFAGAPGTRPGEIGGDEDCLTLNVWTPTAAGNHRPVLVFIHGGGNSIGHAGSYDGGNLAATHDLVVVTVQYRLGPFGWFHHPALRADARSDAEASGNFGTLDLIRALEWVRDDIAAFGGDPANVTIAGESAGALNVNSLLLAPQAHGLFARAIVESGGLWFDPIVAADPTHAPAPGSVDAQTPMEISARLLQRDGTATDRAAALARLATMPAGDTMAWLRGKSAHDVLAAYEPMPSGMITMPRVVQDGIVIPSGDPLAALARDGGWNRVPVLVGTNRDENKLFMFADPTLIHQRLWILPRFVDEASYLATAEYLARLWKAGGADAPAAAIARVEPRVFVYRFDWRDEPTVFGADLAKMLGAAHAFELPFVFGHFDLGREVNALYTKENEAGRLALSRAMMSYWAAFARGGDPGRGVAGDLPTWTAWQDGHFMLLDTERGGGPHMAAGIETRDAILADVERDPRLPTPLARCRTLHALAEWGRGFTAEDYGARPECAPFPYGAFPGPDAH